MKSALEVVAVILLAGMISLVNTPAYAQKKKAETKTSAAAPAPPVNYELNDSHFHLTNYIQEGIDINKFLEVMGDKVGRVALFGIPLQQQWSYGNTGDFAP